MSEGLGVMKSFAEKAIPEFMCEGRIPGFSISVIRDGEIIYGQGFGCRDRDNSLPANSDTLYGIGSCTKSFVALAIFQLAERGKLKLTDKVSDYTPFKLSRPSKPITIHHLLSHSSGVPNLATSTIGLSRGVGVDLGVPWGSEDDFYRLVNDANEEIAADPGLRFFYSNEGYRVLGHLIQNVSGEIFHEYMHRHILQPLEMRRSTFIKKQFDADNNKMTAYWKKPDGTMTPTGFPYPDASENPDFSWNAAAGGLMAPVKELTNYLTCLMNEGRYKGSQIVSPQYVEKAQTPYIHHSQTYFGPSSYGYGWSIQPNFHGEKLVSHGGSLLVATAHLAMIPSLKLGVAMAANTSRPPFATIAEGIFMAIMGKNPYEHPHLILRDKMKRLAGTYQIHMGLEKLRVVNKAGLLYLEQKNHFLDSVTPLIPEDNMLNTLNFYTLTEGIKTPIEFVDTKTRGIDLYVERYRYHKINN